MITGFHTIMYSDDAESTRAFFRDVLEWPSIDAGDGWLIFKTAPSELGVHPTMGEGGETWGTVPAHESSLMCDDIAATVDMLRSKGVEVKGDITDQGYGLVASVKVPGAGWLMLTEPRYEPAYKIEG